MGVRQPATAKAIDYSFVPPSIAAAATRYQTYRVIEGEQLARMAEHDLSKEWSSEVRHIVLNAGDHVRHARDARLLFRAEVRAIVIALRDAQEPLSAVLRHMRTMIRVLEASGALKDDGGWLEAEVLEWAIEEFERAD